MLVQEAPDKIVAYTPMVHAENRGLVRSALQKYIRRGRYEQALRMAAYMKGPTSKELNICGSACRCAALRMSALVTRKL
jgi:hypothetical protein